MKPRAPKTVWSNPRRGRADHGQGHCSARRSRQNQGQYELDLTRTLIDGLVPGLIKPAGRPAKLTFALTPIGDRMSLDNLVFDGGGMSARGQVDLDNDGTLNSLKLSSFKLSPGDDMRVDLTKNGDAMKIIVRASAIDARPFLKSLTEAGRRWLRRARGASFGAGGSRSEIDSGHRQQQGHPQCRCKNDQTRQGFPRAQPLGPFLAARACRPSFRKWIRAHRN